ncbi:type II secretion system protein E [Methanocaldococcus villosus KIN24-T80]|uniref:Type II secretion system protein E n=1 Tax=Methanocaldococcus villosus KIN24-T80 TaxID=1069083 RepID=N6V076_9EURY|nr:CpaF family protein [Methanocaldococcus villosus]ENN95713.1 type II secretion system protein E [Methanocaldococcus villosus KIN24-T80]
MGLIDKIKKDKKIIVEDKPSSILKKPIKKEEDILDVYDVNVDEITFNVIIKKEEGYTYYLIPEIEKINESLSKLSKEHFDLIRMQIGDLGLVTYEQIKHFINDFSIKYNLKLPYIESLAKFFYLISGRFGLLEIPINDERLEEIMINGYNYPVYVFHRKHQMCETNIILDRNEVDRIIESIANLVNRPIDSRTPMLDAFLPDGSRVNATTSDICMNGATLTIRKFSKDPLTVIDLINFGTLDIDTAAFLWQAVEGYFGAKPANTLIVGGTGSGKTTLLNVLSMFSMYNERIITIEDTPELQIPHKHVIKLVTRPARPGMPEYEVTMDDLIKNALRMRPDRIFVGEVRGEEAHSLLVAMNTGHDGCSGTLHANSADEAILRLTSPPMNVPKIMLTALNFIINIQRIRRAGKTIRRILGIVEVVKGVGEGQEIAKTTLYEYNGLKDILEKRGICLWEEEVCEIAGISRDELLRDREFRKRVLNYLYRNNIRDLESVGKYIMKYQENPEKLMKMI